MGYTVVKSFERGIDKRRLLDTTEVGALLDARDCHVTRGGEIEKRAAFVVHATFPATTVGFHAMQTLTGVEFHTWGDAASAPAGMPTGGVYHSIPDPNGLPLNTILAVEEFSGKLYVVARYSDGVNHRVLHWYDDGLLRQWVEPPTPGGGGTPTPGPVPGNPQFEVTFSVSGAAPRQLYGCWANSPSGFTDPIAGFLPDVQIPMIEPDNVDWRDTIVPFCLLDLTGDDPVGWATQVAAAINDYPATSNPTTSPPTPKIRALASGAKVTVWADEIATRLNGYNVYCQGTGIAVAPTAPSFSGGSGPSVPATLTVPTLDPPGTPAPINPGSFALAHDGKMYATSGSTLNFSGIRNATRWDTGVDGAGDIDMTMVAEGTPVLVSLADYGGDLAIFGKRHILIYHMDPDPLQNFKRQILHRTGIIAPHARIPFGQSEVMYLDRSGIRSLRSRSGVDAAFAADLGDPIDELVRAKIAAHGEFERLQHYWAEVEPRSGRLWMALWDRIYVLSYFPGTNIAAWTQYDASAHLVDYMNATDEILWWRSGNNLIAYGGVGAIPTYDATDAVVRLPYVDGGKPATKKGWLGIDLALQGTWSVYASFDPQHPLALDQIANLTQSTYAEQKCPMNGDSPACSLELHSTFVGPARIGNAALHYDDSYAD